MEVFLPLMAAACAFSAVRILIASGERGAKTLASRTLRACERWAGRRLESLGRSDMVAALLEGEDWRQASDALAARLPAWEACSSSRLSRRSFLPVWRGLP